MHIGKALISIFLLAIYTVNVAHNFVPHKQSKESVGCEYVANDLATDNHDEECGELACFTHSYHCDDGLIDLLSCLFSSENHPEDNGNNEVYLPTSADNKQLTDKVKVQLVAVLVSVFLPDFSDISKNFTSVNRPAVYFSPPVSGLTKRGPPSIA